MRIIICRLIASLLFISSSFAADKVVLQLKWEHQFQFAGYYAAQWQGYYKEAGLDVEIRPVTRPDGSIVNPVAEVANGSAHFAVGALDILIAQDQGVGLTVLAPIFQRSATGIFSLKSTSIESLSELAKLKIATSPNDTTRYELLALFKSRGFDLNELKLVDEPVTVETLVSGKADAIATYGVSAKFEAREKGVELNELYPSDYGINFYGDTLYTSQQLNIKRPELVSRFVKASLKGWQYAIANKTELAEKITNTLPRHRFKFNNQLTYNLSFARAIDDLLRYPAVALGDLNVGRWMHMNTQLKKIGLINTEHEPSEVLYDSFALDNEYLNIYVYVVFVFSLLVLSFVFWSKRQLLLTLLSIAGLSVLICYQIELRIKSDHLQEQRLNAMRHLSSISAKLKGNLQTNLSMLRGFAAFISANPGLTEKEFIDYAREIYKKETLLINFAAAKDLVVNYIYPLQGNEKVIGLDYKSNADQSDMVMQVVNTGQLMVVGPVDLIQGGVAFIGRAPVFTGSASNRKLWGIISSPIDASALFRQSGVRDDLSDIHLAIKSYDSLGREGNVFYGKDEIFKSPNHISLMINVGGGSWLIAAEPKLNSQNLSTLLWIIRGIITFTTLLIMFYAVIRYRQEREKRAIQNELVDNKNLLQKVGHVAKVGGWRMDPALNFLHWSEQTSRVIGRPLNYSPASLHELNTYITASSLESWVEHVERAFEDKRSFDIELELMEADRWIRVIGNYSIESNESAITGTVQDISDKIKSSKIIEYQATHDALTGLPNRFLFNDRLEQSIDKACRDNEKVAVLFVDLDRFKPINDNFGHHVGDKILKLVADTLLTCVRESDTVSRLSGDEFGVILPGIEDFNDALKVTELILAKLDSSHTIDKFSMYTSASIGIAVFPEDGLDANSLLRKADQAMYEVKRAGRNGWQFYTREMQKKSEYRHTLLTNLIDAVNKEELHTYFQPIYDIANNKVVKCESLARWFKEDGSLISPNEFIPIAEESGLINRIDMQMFENSVKLLEQLKQHNVTMGLSVNISPRLFQTKDRALEQWFNTVESCSQHFDLTVEITERLLTDESEKAVEVLTKLRELNVKIAIDDFGTGYSSLSYLVKFPVDIIKIDRAFVSAIGVDSSAETLVDTILVMARRLNIQVIAEGIETEQQLTFLANRHCDFGQGFLWAKPMAVDDFYRHLQIKQLMQ
jgi:diguanylate cyclase (GGDEF)-like protein